MGKLFRKIMEDQVIMVDKRYCQIIHLSEDGGVATLKDWAEESLNGEIRTIKVRWEEDVEIIRDGLMKEDKELFCTVYKIMEKEIMVNFQLKLKDPPILKMPELGMDMIFSSLSVKDVLISRLVCPEWGFDILPIQRVFSCKSLSFDPVTPTGVFYNSYKHCAEVSIDLKNLPAMIEASLFEKNGKIDITFFTDPLLPIILEKFLKTKELLYSDDRIDTDSWTSVQNFIANNRQHLESVRIDTAIPEDIVDLEIFANCTSLESLQLIMFRYNSLRNLESLPSSITHLSLLKLSVPLSSTQVSWIVTNLTKLIKLELHVKYTLYEDEEEEGGAIKRSMIVDIVSNPNHPTIQAMNLGLSHNGFWAEDEEMCEGMMAYLEEQLKTKGWEVQAEDSYTIIERLIMNKVGYHNVDSYDDW